MVLKERLEAFLRFVRVELERRGRLSPDKFEGSNGSAAVWASYAAPLAITLPPLLLCVQLISSTRCCPWLQTLAGRWSTFWQQGTSGRGLASVSSRWVGHQEGNTYDHAQCSVEWASPFPPSLPIAIWVCCCCRQAELLSLLVPLPLCASGSLLQPDAHHLRAQAAPGGLGIPLSSAHPRRCPLRPAQPPCSSLPGGGRGGSGCTPCHLLCPPCRL